MSELRILYRDRDFIAIDKPSGLLVHRSEIDRRETRFVLQMLRDQIGQRVYPVHRLDKPTSGVLLFGLYPEAAGRMQQVFRERRVSKSYLAVVRGYLEAAGEIDYSLSDKREREEKRRPEDVRPPQPAVTRYQGLARAEIPVPLGRYASCRYSLVALYPQTGRKHQLRRHMNHIAHPIVGDTRYGEGGHNRLFRQRFDLNRLLLFATGLSFWHPFIEQRVEIRAGLPSAMAPLFEDFGWSLPELLPATPAFIQETTL
ncbi:pseudouridine synthase [Motiliproteus sp. SC1-56]|uniref:pseudouridine synthase n=1 Tax=Motiliproteus sp. SC1-56 TaxID=2799565 RepID=UPI001A905C0D|nr:pseudouridine synthase [Motiliproteus sp. SC1-56]